MANGEYSEMIELPVSTCEMVVAPAKKRRFSKEKLLKRVNKRNDDIKKESGVKSAADSLLNKDIESDAQTDVTQKNTSVVRAKPEKTFKFDVVAAEIIAIFVLVVAILITNIFWEDSGINTMVKSVFGGVGQASANDTRTSRELAVFAPSNSAELVNENGYMTFDSDAAVYAPTNGTVRSITESDGTYTVTISHSDVFHTVISGADAVYLSEGDAVYANIPVAYAKVGTTVAMYDNGKIATDFIIDNGKIVWQN